MGVFASIRTFNIKVADLTPVAEELMEYYKKQGYEVKGEKTITNGWHVSISKGGIFKSVVGLKTALNIEIEPQGNTTTAKADVGIFGLQAIPSAVMLFIAWPVLLTQIWGLVQQANLDDEALNKIGEVLMSMTEKAIKDNPLIAASMDAKFCPACGSKLVIPSKFCPECGGKLE
ncbi:MAG: zinc ribbon domain-containing protein [Deltaproteobacteria bacterium]